MGDVTLFENEQFGGTSAVRFKSLVKIGQWNWPTTLFDSHLKTWRQLLVLSWCFHETTSLNRGVC